MLESVFLRNISEASSRSEYVTLRKKIVSRYSD
jgi:hypothetical protein